MLIPERSHALGGVQRVDSLIQQMLIECLPAPGSQVGKMERRANKTEDTRQKGHFPSCGLRQVVFDVKMKRHASITCSFTLLCCK